MPAGHTAESGGAASVSRGSDAEDDGRWKRWSQACAENEEEAL